MPEQPTVVPAIQQEVWASSLGVSMAQGFADGVVARTPSRWLPLLLRLTSPLVSDDDREAFFRAFAEMGRGSCVLPPPLEIFAPRFPCRTLLARTALGLFARDAVHDRMRWHERDERGRLGVVP